MRRDAGCQLAATGRRRDAGKWGEHCGSSWRSALCRRASSSSQPPPRFIMYNRLHYHKSSCCPAGRAGGGRREVACLPRVPCRRRILWPADKQSGADLSLLSSFVLLAKVAGLLEGPSLPGRRVCCRLPSHGSGPAAGPPDRGAARSRRRRGGTAALAAPSRASD